MASFSYSRFAATVNPESSVTYLDDYIKPRGLIESTGRVCLGRLVGHQCHGWECRHQVPGGLEGCLWKGADHSALWLKDGRPYSITSQPYGVHEDQIEDLLTRANALGLAVSFDGASWHYPGSTVLIEVRRPGPSVWSRV